jgi:hypothetical protein
LQKNNVSWRLNKPEDDRMEDMKRRTQLLKSMVDSDSNLRGPLLDLIFLKGRALMNDFKLRGFFIVDGQMRMNG